MTGKIRIEGYRREGFVKDVTPGRKVVMRRIEPTTVKGHFRKDTGVKGKTEESKKWYEFSGKNLHGWSKEQPIMERRRRASINRDDLSSGRALNQIKNLSADRATKQAAGADAKYFFEKHNIRVKTHR